jgi:hypothetical protein
MRITTQVLLLLAMAAAPAMANVILTNGDAWVNAIRS